MTSEIKQFNFTEAQVAKLCKMQDELNTYIHPEWKTQGFNWNLAIIDECMEIHGHLGWKWWKKGYNQGLTEANKKQVQLEVIDILHFILSYEIQLGTNEGRLKAGLNYTPQIRYQNFTVDYHTDVAISACAEDDLSICGWANLAHSVDLTEKEILETYTQKYVLNKFRQDHGYKDGSYVKEWTMQNDFMQLYKLEDNEVLTNVVIWLKATGQDTTDEQALYNRLELHYNSRLNK